MTLARRPKRALPERALPERDHLVPGAIGRHLEEVGVLTVVPGRTAGELARDAGAAVPDVATEIATAAALFNDVTYGDQPGSEADYRLVVAVDDRLRTTAATPAAGPR